MNTIQTLDELAITTIRTLSIDAIEKENSGHPGLPMGAAPMAYELWTKHMNHNPKNPTWFNRDRFILSALLAAGSEVQLALHAQRELLKENIFVSVISFPSWDRFEAQSTAYKESVLLPNVKARLAIEMGSSMGWNRYVGAGGEILAIDQFGTSGAESKVLKEYGFA